MNPTVPETSDSVEALAEDLDTTDVFVPGSLSYEAYEQLRHAGVAMSDRAVMVLAVHAHRTRLTRYELVEVISRFAPAVWDERTVEAAGRLVAAIGEPGTAGQLVDEIAARAGHPGHAAEAAWRLVAAIGEPGRVGQAPPSGRVLELVGALRTLNVTTPVEAQDVLDVAPAGPGGPLSAREYAAVLGWLGHRRRPCDGGCETELEFVVDGPQPGWWRHVDPEPTTERTAPCVAVPRVERAWGVPVPPPVVADRRAVQVAEDHLSRLQHILAGLAVYYQGLEVPVPVEALDLLHQLRDPTAAYQRMQAMWSLEQQARERGESPAGGEERRLQVLRDALAAEQAAEVPTAAAEAAAVPDARATGTPTETAEPARCGAAHPDTWKRCSGPGDAVRVVDEVFGSVTGCVEHAAVMLAAVECARVYPGSVDGAAIEAYERAQVLRDALAAEQSAEVQPVTVVVPDSHASGDTACPTCGAGEQFCHPEVGPMPGYYVGRCGHRVAGSEWRAGYRTCERCSDPGCAGCLHAS